MSIVLLCGTLSAWAQYQGLVVDEQNRPLAFVNVEALALPDSTFLRGGVTDAQGSFSFEQLPAEVVLRVRRLGYATLHERVAQWPVRLQLTEEAVELGEAVVRAGLPTFRLSNEGIITTVEGSVLSTIGDATDVLKRIPAVRQSGEDFEVLGRGSATIYINGRRMHNPDELKSLASEQIVSVEVINHPGVRYAATTTAVIRIRTKRPVGEGLGGALRASYYQGENADFVDVASWNYRRGAWDVFGTHTYQKLGGGSHGPLGMEAYVDTLWQQRLNQTVRSTTRRLDNTLGFNYQPFDSTSLGLRYTFRNYLYDKTRAWFDATVMANGQLYDKNHSVLNAECDAQPYHYWAGYYYKKTKQLDVQLDLTYLHRSTAEELHTVEQSQLEAERQVHFNSTSRYSLWASRVAATWKVGQSELTFGGEWTTVDNESGHATPQRIVDDAIYKVRERHLAGFAEWTWRNALGRLSSGVRYETIWYDLWQNKQKERSQTQHEWFPSFRFGTKVGASMWQLAYSYRTSRPQFQQLTQGVIYANRFVYQRSNPKLLPEHVHDLSLNGSWKMMQWGVNYRDRRSAIVLSSLPLEADNRVSVITHRNVPSVKSVSAFWGAVLPLGWWEGRLQASGSRQWFSLPTIWGTHHYNKPMVSLSLGNIFTLSPSWKATADFSYTTKGHTNNYYLRKPVFRTDLSLTKSFYDERLRLTLGVQDLFDQASRRRTIVNYNAVSRNDVNELIREVYLTLRYRFNAARSKYKGKGAGQAEINRL